MPIGSLVLRALATAAVACVCIALMLLSAIPYGGGNREVGLVAATTVAFMVGWTLLPLVRWNRVGATVALAIWVALGTALMMAPDGALVAPWLLSSVALYFLVFARPNAKEALPEGSNVEVPPSEALARAPATAPWDRWTYAACVTGAFLSSLLVVLAVSGWHMLLPVSFSLTPLAVLVPWGGLPAVTASAIVLLVLSTRRAWRHARGHGQPAAFAGPVRWLARIGLVGFAVHVALMQQALRGGLEITAAMGWFLQLGTLGPPWTVLIVELRDVWRQWGSRRWAGAQG